MGRSRSVLALNNITLQIGAAERVAVMGPSGSGKSTLLNLVCGLDEPTSGSLKVEGVELSGLTDDARTRLRREKIGMIFQTFNLLSTLTALENVALPLRLQGLSKKEAEGRATSMLATWDWRAGSRTGPMRCRAANGSGLRLRGR